MESKLDLSKQFRAAVIEQEVSELIREGDANAFAEWVERHCKANPRCSDALFFYGVLSAYMNADLDTFLWCTYCMGGVKGLEFVLAEYFFCIYQHRHPELFQGDN